ncbi:hypothetical protein ACZ11_00430 [Lysinibacillus xylanilyticus]|uniref:Nitrite reductase n=1 Tax=Lysinibacillus xylanilyticus TaxID=582475 RepID=A0A0K9FGF0_9BACI|nr:hypothetical protein [Lysinibacillus xylanilyticus]KMY33589.1 hypothetical protein ACZ11_00430 [Lysinibacillus xylanilyticus]
MKKLWRWVGLVVIYIIGIYLSLLSGVYLLDGRTALDTKKIDNNIKKLRMYPWFNELYEHEEHHRSFFANIKVRKYLESSIRVSRLLNNEREQKRFIRMLEEVAQVRKK